MYGTLNVKISMDILCIPIINVPITLLEIYCLLNLKIVCDIWKLISKW